jgi:hypothetical protein
MALFSDKRDCVRYQRRRAAEAKKLRGTSRLNDVTLENL